MTPALPVFLGAYLLGSIPFGLLLVRLAGKGDLRAIGSGNIGATNVLRTGSRKLAALTLLLDGAKGAVAVLLAAHLMPSLVYAAALGAFVGHLFPVWLKFCGGKGVATTLGLYLALNWMVGLVACATWLLTAFIFRYSSLAALVAVAVAPVAGYFLGGADLALFGLVIGAVVWWRHEANIRRLLNRTEPRIGSRKKVAG